MKKFCLIIFIFSLNHVCAQPLKTSPVMVKTIYFQNKPVNFERIVNTNDYIHEDIFSNNNDKYIGISPNLNTNFIYENDTMSVKLIFNKYSPLKFQISNFKFTKGNYIIDLQKCLKKLKTDTYPIIIENFPCDCIAYRKEDEKENKK